MPRDTKKYHITNPYSPNSQKIQIFIQIYQQTNKQEREKMSSLPVKNLYQCIGEQVEALPNAVVHIENSVYLRSKAITADSESLRNFIDYAIKVIILEFKTWLFKIFKIPESTHSFLRDFQPFILDR